MKIILFLLLFFVIAGGLWWYFFGQNTGLSIGQPSQPIQDSERLTQMESDPLLCFQDSDCTYECGENGQPSCNSRGVNVHYYSRYGATSDACTEIGCLPRARYKPFCRQNRCVVDFIETNSLE